MRVWNEAVTARSRAAHSPPLQGAVSCQGFATGGLKNHLLLTHIKNPVLDHPAVKITGLY